MRYQIIVHGPDQPHFHRQRRYLIQQYIDNDGNVDNETILHEIKEEIDIVNGWLREYKCISKQYRDVFVNEESK